MLVHHAMQRAVHSEKAAEVRALWANGGYFAPASGDRLRRLYETDFLPVCRAVAPKDGSPATYDDLTPYVAQAVRTSARPATR